MSRCRTSSSRGSIRIERCDHVWKALRNGADNLRELALAAETSQSKARVVLSILKEMELLTEGPNQSLSGVARTPTSCSWDGPLSRIASVEKVIAVGSGRC
jgi:hypothetical protein